MINSQDNISKYLTQEHNENKVQPFLKELVDYNKCLKYFEKEVPTNIKEKEKPKIYIKCEIYDQETLVAIPFYTPIKKIDEIQTNVLLNIEYNKLTFTTIQAFTVFSVDRNGEIPIGGTIISLYDELLKQREGPYLQLLWPDRYPDVSFDTCTPGLVSEPFFERINTNSQRIDSIQHHIKEAEGFKRDYFLQSKNYLNKHRLIVSSIPFAFLEIYQKSWSKAPIIYQEKIQQISETRNDIVYFKDQYNDGKKPEKQSKFEANFISTRKYQNILRIRDYDWDLNRKDCTMELWAAMLTDGDVDPTQQTPTMTQQKQLENIRQRPNFLEIEAEGKILVMKFRYYFMNLKGSQPKYLSCMILNKDRYPEALEMLKQWKQVSFDEAIFLLSKNFCLNKHYNQKIKVNNDNRNFIYELRKFAVTILENEEKKKLNLYLQQLVAALRYEEFTYAEEQNNENSPKKNSPQQEFQLKRVMDDVKCCSQFYWYVFVETDQVNKSVKDWYEFIQKTYLKKLNQKNKEFYEIIQGQIEFRTNIQKINKQIRNSNDKQQKFDKELKIDPFINEKDGKMFKIKNMFLLNPEIFMTRVKRTHMFRSNACPFGIWFDIKDQPKKEYGIMYKNGDDLRADQLIMQFINLLSFMMNKVEVDLMLSPYSVLAFSKSDGVHELCPKSTDLQDINKVYTGPVNFFVKLVETRGNAKKDTKNKDSQIKNEEIDPFFAPQESEKNNLEDYNVRIREKLDSNFILSCAGYCVITYLMGVGDRHLENVMMDDYGKFFHIDFGYIFDEDPNLSNPPPFKITVEMIKIFDTGNNRTKFVNKCVAVYKQLRNNANILVNLMYQMTDSDLITNPKKKKTFNDYNVEQVCKKLQMGKNDKEAERYFEELLNASQNNFRAKIQDKLHILRGFFT